MVAPYSPFGKGFKRMEPPSTSSETDDSSSWSPSSDDAEGKLAEARWGGAWDFAWRHRLCRFSATTVLMLAVSALAVLTYTRRPALSSTCRLATHEPVALVYVGSGMPVYAAAAVFMYKSRGARDVVTALASRYALLAPSLVFLMGLTIMMRDFMISCPTAPLLPDLVVKAVVMPILPTLVFTFFHLVEDRLILTEAGFGEGLGSVLIRRGRFAYLLLELLFILYRWVMLIRQNWGFLTGSASLFSAHYKATLMVQWKVAWLYETCHNSLTGVAYVAVGLVAFRGFSSVLSSTNTNANVCHLGSYAGREKRWAQRVFNFLRWATLTQCLLSGGLHLVIVAFFCSGDYSSLFFSIAQPILILMEMGFLLVITGSLEPGTSMEPRSPRSSASLPDHPGLAARSERWRSTTEDLAGRGISLEALLDFYEALGKPDGPMPHYDPEVSTTNDVVRQAIIPQTRTATGGAAYARSLPPGSVGLPEVMVTHTWSGLFLDLLATVVADARGRTEYMSTAEELATDCGRLRASLDRRGVLGQTYWICAFSVNQHSGICGSLGQAPAEGSAQFARWDKGRRDSVTKQVFAACACSHPKYWNDLHPNECEMNKFDDMMGFLSDRVGGFSHLVAVDRDYTVFERAWCVAELHRAYVTGLSQRVCLHSNSVLEESCDLAVYRKLATLTVTACQASRPQDKEDILSRIADTDEFDEQLQHAIFGSRGLLAQHFKGFGVLEAAARTAFRVAHAQALGHGDTC